LKSRSEGSKLIAIVLVALVVGAGLGYWLFVPKVPSEVVSYTAQRTSLSTTSEQTFASSTLSTAVATEMTLWLNVSVSKPVSYYVSLLKSTQTQPYVQLAWELQALPDATNATAVAKITYLALNATNPEVKEAFELMMKGGTPSPSDFTYTVPKYNTELQGLYWLACENEFKKDDTLALAIAMVSGIWVTSGDQQVRDAVKIDTKDLLIFFRDTNELRKRRGYHQLEDYPIEAMICLVWSGSAAVYMNWPGHALSGVDREVGRPIRAGIKDYAWDTVAVQTLREMQEFMIEMGWFKDDSNSVNQLVESYFYLDGPAHWDNPTDPNNLGGLRSDVPILVDGEKVLPRNFWNVDFIWAYFKKTGRGIGVCADNSAFVDALNKAIGIPTTSNGLAWVENGEPGGHGFVTYYVPHLQRWKSLSGHLRIRTPGGWLDETQVVYLQLFVPAWNQRGYLKWRYEAGRGFYETPAFYSPQMKLSEAWGLFSSGVPSSQMKQWLLYS